MPILTILMAIDSDSSILRNIRLIKNFYFSDSSGNICYIYLCLTPEVYLVLMLMHIFSYTFKCLKS